MNEEVNNSCVLEEEIHDKRFTTLKKEKNKYYDEKVELLTKVKDKLEQNY